VPQDADGARRLVVAQQPVVRDVAEDEVLPAREVRGAFGLPRVGEVALDDEVAVTSGEPLVQSDKIGRNRLRGRHGSEISLGGRFVYSRCIGIVPAMDDVDRELLKLLQQDAGMPYTALCKAVGLSAGAAHDRVRKLRERGVIRRTTIEIDPSAVGRGVLAFVMVDANAWMGDPSTREALAQIAEIEEAHIVAGSASVLVKVRTASTEELQQALRRIFGVDGVTGTDAIVVLETFFERPTHI
jgi:DNA-binding Lrp family transcriptional regulator